MDATVMMDGLDAVAGSPPVEPAASGSQRGSSVEPAAPPWAPPDVEGTATGALLDAGEVSWLAVLRRLGAALALSAAFGVALGMRRGGVALVVHGAGVPLGFAVVAGLVAPALFIGLLHTGLRVEARQMADALSRSAATSGLILAGLSPLAALVAVSSESGASAAAFGWLGLSLGGALGLRQLARDVAPMLARETVSRRLRAQCTVAAFGLVSALLTARLWASALPVLGGGAP